jgi:hypothetical protein
VNLTGLRTGIASQYNAPAFLQRPGNTEIRNAEVRLNIVYRFNQRSLQQMLKC